MKRKYILNVIFFAISLVISVACDNRRTRDYGVANGQLANNALSNRPVLTNNTPVYTNPNNAIPTYPTDTGNGQIIVVKKGCSTPCCKKKCKDKETAKEDGTVYRASRDLTDLPAPPEEDKEDKKEKEPVYTEEEPSKEDKLLYISKDGIEDYGTYYKLRDGTIVFKECIAANGFDITRKRIVLIAEHEIDFDGVLYHLSKLDVPAEKGTKLLANCDVETPNEALFHYDRGTNKVEIQTSSPAPGVAGKNSVIESYDPTTSTIITTEGAIYGKKKMWECPECEEKEIVQQQTVIQEIQKIEDKLNKVYGLTEGFPQGKYTITESIRSDLDEVAILLKEVSEADSLVNGVNIIGHTSWEGSRAGNNQLSIDRAVAVKTYLESKGLQVKLTASGRGMQAAEDANKKFWADVKSLGRKNVDPFSSAYVIDGASPDTEVNKKTAIQENRIKNRRVQWQFIYTAVTQ